MKTEPAKKKTILLEHSGIDFIAIMIISIDFEGCPIHPICKGASKW